ncbi:hypothetical protein [Oxalicibacterium solurbis]|uniref:Formate dehydrogenase region TAT target n=1 Tax=Oxalicibacterium solurbis TaxID=69280 RepID=A0A8J3AYV5_9BURK|nr:hypothetical protein [Oxalicibacterium solurbis]GGI54656.1 hypothetical protein GCM10011430_18300 [Oxalicibacterium solurbis]
MAEQQPKPSRRSFFAGLGAVAAAGAAAKLLPQSSQALTDSAVAAPEPTGDSYRLTEHVKKYYRTTTI